MVPVYSHGTVGWRRREEDNGSLQGSGDEDAPPPLRQETGLTQGTLDSAVTDATCQTGYTESTVEPGNLTVLVPQLGLDGETSLPIRPSPSRQIKYDSWPDCPFQFLTFCVDKTSAGHKYLK